MSKSRNRRESIRNRQIRESRRRQSQMQQLEPRQLMAADLGVVPESGISETSFSSTLQNDSLEIVEGSRTQEEREAAFPKPQISLEGTFDFDGRRVQDLDQKPPSFGTMSLEFKTDHAHEKTSGYLVGHFHHASRGGRIYVYLSRGDLYVRLGSQRNGTKVAENVADGSWHHLALVYGAKSQIGEARVYLDGELVASVEASHAPLQTSQELMVGGTPHVQRGRSQLYYSGSIRQVRFYDAAMADSDLRVLTHPVLTPSNIDQVLVADAPPSEADTQPCETPPEARICLTSSVASLESPPAVYELSGPVAFDGTHSTALKVEYPLPENGSIELRFEPRRFTSQQQYVYGGISSNYDRFYVYLQNNDLNVRVGTAPGFVIADDLQLGEAVDLDIVYARGEELLISVDGEVQAYPGLSDNFTFPTISYVGAVQKAGNANQTQLQFYGSVHTFEIHSETQGKVANSNKSVVGESPRPSNNSDTKTISIDSNPVWLEPENELDLAAYFGSDDYATKADLNFRSRPFQLSASVSQGLGWTGVAAAASDAIGFLPGAIFSSGSLPPGTNPFPDLSKTQVSSAQKVGDVLYGGNRDDTLILGKIGTIAIGGKGDDKIKLTANDTQAHGNRGNDTFEMSGERQTAFGGSGNNTYRLLRGVKDGQIVDTSAAGQLEIEVSIADVSLRERRGTLQVKTADGRNVSIPEFGQFNRDGWTIKTTEGTYRLTDLMRPSTLDAAVLANTVYPENATDLQEIGFDAVDSIDHPASGLRANIYRRESFRPSSGDVASLGGDLPEGHYAVSITGTEEGDFYDLVSDAQLGSPQTQQLFQELEPLVLSGQANDLTLSGHSLGGIVAVRSGAQLAMINPDVNITVYAFNAVGLSDEALQYYDLPNLHIEFINGQHDILHAIGEDLGFGYPDSAVVRVIPALPGTPFSVVNGHSMNPILQILSRERGSDHSRLRTNDSSLDQMEAALEQIDSSFKDALETAIAGLDLSFDPTGVDEFVRRFDFGRTDLAEADFITIASDQKYHSGGSGWKSGTTAEVIDRIVNGELLRDAAIGEQLEFWSDTPAGSYNVRLRIWDTVERDRIGLFINDEYQGQLDSLSNQERLVTLRIEHDGGPFKIRMEDYGGQSRRAVLNGLEIERVAAWAALPESEVRIDPSVIVLVPGADDPVTWFDRAVEIGKPIFDLATTIGSLVAAPAITPLLAAKSLYKGGNSIFSFVQAFQDKPDSTPAWVFDTQVKLNQTNARAGLPLITTEMTGLTLGQIEDAIRTGGDRLEKLVGEVIIVDAGRTLNNGVQPYGAFFDGVKDEDEHREAIDRTEFAIRRAIATAGREQMEQAGADTFDVLAIGSDFGATALHEAIDVIATKPIAASIDHFQVEMINPIAAKEVSAYHWYHIESRPFSLEVTHWSESRTDVPDDFEKQTPLDGRKGGAHLNRLNSLVLEYGPDSPNGERQYRNLSARGRYVSGGVRALDLSDDQRYMAQVSRSGFLSVFDLNNSIRAFDARIFGENAPTHVRFSPDNQRVAVLNEKGRFAVVDLESDRTFELKIKNVVAIEWTVDGSRLIAARKNGEVFEIPVTETGLQAARTIAQAIEGLADLWVTSDRVITRSGRTFQAWSWIDPVGNRSAQLTTRAEMKVASDVTAAAVSGNGTIVAIATGNQVDVYTSNSGFEHRLTLTDHRHRVDAIAFSGDGTSFFTGGRDRQIRQTDAIAALDGRRVVERVVTAPMLDVRHLVADANGNRVFAAFENGAGGSVVDRSMTDVLNDRLPFWSDIGSFGFGEAKIGQMVPHAWAEEFAGKLRFFRQKDNPIREAVFGRGRLDRHLALPESSAAKLPDEPDSTETSPPTITPIERISRFSIQAETTLPFRIADYFEYDGEEDLQYTVKSSLKALKVRIDPDSGRVILTPKPHSEGTALVTLGAADSQTSASLVVAIAFEGKNRPPEATNIQKTVRPGGRLDIKVGPAVSDPDGDSVRLESFTQPPHGTAKRVHGKPNQIRYIADEAFTGTVEFTYQVKDEYGETTRGTIEISVVNSAPIAPTIRVTTRPGKVAEIKIRDHASDADGDKVSLTAVGSASNGRARARQNYPNQARYTPNAEFTGIDRFTYTISDGKGGTATGTIEVSVVNSAPTAPTIRVKTRPGRDVDIRIRDYVSDADGDTVSLTAVGSASNGLARARQNYPNQVRFTPRNGFVGKDRFAYTVIDSHGAAVSGFIEVEVFNSAPTAPIIRLRMLKNTVLDIKVRDYVSDVDGDVVSLSSVADGSNGDTKKRSRYPNQIRYTPRLHFTGSDQFTYQVSDGKGGLTTGIVVIEIV